MSKHTPGPWAFSQSNQYGDTRFYVAQADCATYTPHYSDVATLIAETVSSELRTIQEANARLIAAAPELLAALIDLKREIILSDVDMKYIESHFAPWIEKARAVIAKAEGTA